MNCRLCGANTKLQNSHIIPEFVYKSMYDKKHTFMKISSSPYRKTQLLKKGLREKLLCYNCEQKLSRYENYIYKFIYEGKKGQGILKNSIVYLKNLDYKQIRIYYLSIIWRMSIASHAIFAKVSLGPHEERIKNLIDKDDPGDPSQYGFLCVAPLIENQIYSDWILQPLCGKFENHKTYCVLIGGLLYIYFISSHGVSQSIQKGFIQKNGNWTIKHKNAKDILFLDKLLTIFAKANRKK